MTDSLSRLDDLEIYLASQDLAAIISWLQQLFDSCEVKQRSPQGATLLARHQNHPLSITLSRNAGQKRFTSVWVKSRHAPWQDDLAMARAAYAQFQLPVRCIESAWQEGDNTDLWWEITERGEHTIQWST